MAIMRKLYEHLTAFTCKQFSHHVASGVLPLEGGLYRRFQFWVHWVICPFCRRYWKEISALGETQRKMVLKDGSSFSAVKERIRAHLKKRTL